MPPSASATTSLSGNSVAFADDSGTEYMFMTFSTGSKWDGKALAVLDVIGAVVVLLRHMEVTM